MAKNTANTAKKMIGMLGVYDADNILVKVSTFNRTISAGTSEQFAIGTTMPSDPSAYAKVFVWDSLDSMQPILETIKFE